MNEFELLGELHNIINKNTDENKYLLTTSLVSDTYREEVFYFLGLDDSSITEQEKQQVCDVHSLLGIL